jgi:hypothetical protein
MIYHIIKIKRGLLANLPTLSAGELAYTTDTKELYIGTSTGTNIRLTYDGVETDIDALEADLNEAFTRNYTQDKKLEDLENSIRASLTGDVYGSIDIAALVEHLPATIAKAPIKVKGKGLSLDSEQLVTNGDAFVDVDTNNIADGWQKGLNILTYSFSDGTQTWHSTGVNPASSQTQVFSYPYTWTLNDKYYFNILAKADSLSASIYFGQLYQSGTLSQSITSLSFNNYSLIHTPTVAYNFIVFGGNGIYTYDVKQFYAFNISALITAKQYSPLYRDTFDNLTDEQIKAQMDAWVQQGDLPYEGRKDIVNPTIESVGKNLFDKETLEVGDINQTTGLNQTNTARCRTIGYISVKPSTTYYLSKLDMAQDWWSVRAYDYNKEPIGTFWLYNLNNTGSSFTTPNNVMYIRIKFDDSLQDVLNANVQLEANTVATTYEPYIKQSKTYVGTFRSVGSVQDEFSDGGVKIKKVGVDINDVVQSATSWGSANILTNTKQYYKNLASSLLYKIVLSNGIIANISLRIGTDVYNVVTNTALASTDTEKLICIDVAGNLGIRVNKTTYPDSASFEAYLQANDVEFIYELANPVEEPISILGSSILMGEPRGQIRQTSLNGAVDIYSAPTGIVVTDPIEEVTELIKLNAEGVQELLDLSNVTIAGDSLSFTSTDLSEGDAIYYTYKPIEARINGSLSIDYYTNDVVVDDVTGDIYKWSVAASNGVLSLEGEVIG